MSEIHRLGQKLSLSSSVLRKAEEFERKAQSIRIAGPGVAAVCLQVSEFLSALTKLSLDEFLFFQDYTLLFQLLSLVLLLGSLVPLNTAGSGRSKVPT